MKDFILEETSKTPKIIFKPKSGLFEISGKSIPENSAQFFDPVISWINEYISNPAATTTMIIKLEYFNTSSSKYLVEIFRKLEVLVKSGKEVLIKWFYEEEDEDMLESGEDFKEIIKVPVELNMI
ncbi:DUF1987 domain-containing protein [Bacteroidota bacterium]